jgi:zinc transporter
VADPTSVEALPPLGALLCDGAGGARAVELHAVPPANPNPGGPWPWAHLDHADPEQRRWLRERSGLDEVLCSALLEEETRPRLVRHGEGALVILRGVNLTPGAEPDDMISLRIWLEPGRVISLRHRRLHAVRDVREHLAAGSGPRSAGEMLVAIAGGLVARQGSVVDAMEDSVDEVEEQMMTHPARELRVRLADFRRQAIGLRRYIAPQRDVLYRLVQEPLPWLDDQQRARLREICEHQVRLVEEVDAVRERAAVTQEELAARLSEQMNRNTYMLSVVAGVFLPLGLLTGLLGINVGGIPGTENPNAFVIVCVTMVVLAAAMWWFFRRFRML